MKNKNKTGFKIFKARINLILTCIHLIRTVCIGFLEAVQQA